MIDEQGYRLNVGIILCNSEGKLLWARRVGALNAWQFPQGGMMENEEPQEAMYRELLEELGLKPQDVEILAETKSWLSYLLPEYFRRYDSHPVCIGQKQKWFLLRLLAEDDHIQLDYASEPEFSQWMWVDYWLPVKKVIAFKRSVYRRALQEFEPKIKRLLGQSHGA